MTEKKKVKAFTVDAKNWIRGNKFSAGEGSCLLSSHGKMCCLGFFGEACGVERINLKDCEAPVPSAKIHEKFPDWNYQPFMIVNDDEKLSDKERVKKLKGLFAQRGVTVKFINLPKGDSFTKPYRSSARNFALGGSTR